MKVISFILFFLIACLPLSQAIRSNPSEDLGGVQGLFIFGDSALDAGQNTYIPGSRIMSAVPPYGKSYFDKPTGRWTDGRTIGDFLAQALGLPLLPPYLRPGANFSSGVNFASAGAGLLDETNAHQLHQFRNVIDGYKRVKGADSTTQFLKSSIAMFSIGANDIANNAPGNSLLFQEMLETYSNAIQNLAIKIHNDYRDLNIVTLNPTTVVLTILSNPDKYGFKEAEKACCGGGPFNAAEFCADVDKHDWKPNHKNKYQQSVCSNPKDYLYFDSNHFTEAGTWMMLKNFWYGSYAVAKPSNLSFFLSRFTIPNPPPKP
ncbi:GDSL esterase/lipase 1 [Selaginella moellendorffii]|uniref:GDSL esterase/lipase 1 n=1 Tax=Selaginella moellendorffii TaxID=88036 RepID=UPI000D1CDD55|nr:GDSL esterase/lipase 1 [Selaginella moellendorffii]|eukprot:XP_024521694.1 GDSL esterase/lipase 1 [Selaginella moellendorffii]